MIAKYKAVLPIVLTMLIFPTSSVAESKIVFAPIISLSANEFDVTTNQFGGDSVNYQSIKVGLVSKVENWTLRFSNERPLSNEEIEFNPVMGNSDLDIKNHDINLSYSFDNDVSVFAGYLNNDFSFTNRNLFVPFGSRADYLTSYSELGFYYGAGYSYQVGPGTIIATIAYAFLDATYTDNFYEVGLPGLITDGETTGLSYSLSWQSNINENLLYSLGIFVRRFDYDSNFKSGLPEFPGLGKINDNSFDSQWNLSAAALTFVYIF